MTPTPPPAACKKPIPFYIFTGNEALLFFAGGAVFGFISGFLIWSGYV